MSRDGSWAARSWTTSTCPRSATTASSSSIREVRNAVWSSTARGVKRRLTKRRWARCSGSSSAIVFDSSSAMFARYEPREENTSLRRSTSTTSAWRVTTQYPLASLYTGASRRAHVKNSWTASRSTHQAGSRRLIGGASVAVMPRTYSHAAGRAVRAQIVASRSAALSGGVLDRRVDVGGAHVVERLGDVLLGLQLRLSSASSRVLAPITLRGPFDDEPPTPGRRHAERMKSRDLGDGRRGAAWFTVIRTTLCGGAVWLR